MKKFAFRLQRVLDLREAQEQLKLSDFGREQTRLGEEQERLDLFRQEAQLQCEELRHEASQPFPAWARGMGTRYLQRIGRVIDYQTGRVELQSRNVEAARTRYLEARRETQVLEKLREQHRNDWQTDVLREEGKILDEVGSRRTMGEA